MHTFRLKIIILQLHHKTTSFLQYLIPILLPNSVQISISLKYLQTTSRYLCNYYSEHFKTYCNPTYRHIGYIEVPITNEKPKFFQVNDINTLIPNVTHTYHPNITEPLPQTNYIVQFDDPTTPPPQFSLHQINMTNNDIPNQTFPLYNVQPTSHTSEKRIFPSLPYTSENLKFINKFKFQFSDLTDSEYITLCNMLLKYKTCYATHKNDDGKISTPFRIRLKPNAQLLTQRPSKVPIHY